MGCSPAHNEIVSSKIKRTNHSHKKSYTTEDALKMMAQGVAGKLRSLPGTGKKLSFGVFDCANRIDGKPLSQNIHSFLQGYLIQFSGWGGYALVDIQYKSTDNVSGEIVISPDYTLLGSCLRGGEVQTVTVRLLEVRTKKSLAQFSHKFKLTDETAAGEFLVSRYILVDTATRLVWDRIVNNRQYNYQVATSYCGGLIIDGYSDWRLPTHQELYTIIARPLENRQKLFGYDYGMLFENYSCHWFLKDPELGQTAVGINLNTGKLVSKTGLKQYLSIFMESECQVKCVRNPGTKIKD